MGMMNVLGTTNGVALYNGSSVTCYPGSNQTDNGKLQLEFNMARLVTRLSSKNFCVTNPSFVVTKIHSAVAGIYQLRVSAGQASINGMDLIITDSIDVNPPEEDGTYYLALRLQRDDDAGTPDGRGNVLGDLVIGVDTIFQGVCVTYLDSKDESDKDILYLAEITYEDGDFTSIEEDGDKYGRIWAEDILCKWNDLIPSHKPPYFTDRPTLQELLFKIPDWYVSKDGDVEYEAIEWLPGRQNGTYTYDDYGTGKYGIYIKADTDSQSTLKIKPSYASEVNNSKLVYGVSSGYNSQLAGIRINIGDNTIENDPDNASGDRLRINVPYSLSTSSNQVQVYATDTVTLQAQNSGSSVTNLQLLSNNLTFSSGTNDLIEKSTVSSTVFTKQIGKTQLTYTKSNSTFKMLGTDTTYFNIVPKLDVDDQARFKNKILLGNSATYGNEPSFLKDDQLRLSTEAEQSGVGTTNIRIGYADFFGDDNVIGSGNTSTRPYVQVANWGVTKNTKILDGSILIRNAENNARPSLKFSKGNSTYDVVVQHDVGTDGSGSGTVGQLGIVAGHVILSGDLTVNQDIRARKVYNAVYNDYAEYFRKDENEEILPRDIVCIREDGLVHKVETEEDLDRIVGICSDTAGHILGGAEWKEEEKVVVGLVGKLYVNTDEDIKPGDLVEAAADNKVVKCYSRLSRLGIALEEAKDGKVLIIYNG